MEFVQDNETNSNIVNLSISERPANHKTNYQVPDYSNEKVQTTEPRINANESVTVEMAPSTEEKNVLSAADQPPAPEKEEKKHKHHHHHKKGKPPDVVTFRTHITSLAHISVLVFVYMVIKLSFRGDFVFFTWHPILMSVGWMLLMTEGFYAINKYNTYWRFKTKGGFRVKIHVIILSIGYILSIAGFIIVYINKDRNNKPHFASWHGLFGLIGIVATFPPVINGFVLWYKKELSDYIWRPRMLKFVHVSTGTIAFLFGALSLVLSVYTRWYAKKSNKSDYIFYLGLISVTFPLFWAVYGPSVKLARTIREYFSEEKEDIKEK